MPPLQLPCSRSPRGLILFAPLSDETVAFVFIGTGPRLAVLFISTACRRGRFKAIIALERATAEEKRWNHRLRSITVPYLEIKKGLLEPWPRTFLIGRAI